MLLLSDLLSNVQSLWKVCSRNVVLSANVFWPTFLCSEDPGSADLRNWIFVVHKDCLLSFQLYKQLA